MTTNDMSIHWLWPYAAVEQAADWVLNLVERWR